MKKNHFFLLMFGFFFSANAVAQLVANDNVSIPTNGLEYNGFALYALGNDTLNGAPVSPNTVTVTQVSSSSWLIAINSQGQVSVAGGTPAGTYTLVYQICEIANPSNCDTATVTMNICDLPAPIIGPPSCSELATSLTLFNLPSGNWTITHQINWDNTVTINGSGYVYTVDGISPGSHSFRITDASGCVSPTAYVYIGYFDGLDVDIVGTYVDFNNDDITNVGDIISYQLAITNLLPCDLTDLVFGEANYGMSFPNDVITTLAANATNNSVVGTYVLAQSDINAGSVSQWVSILGMTGGSTVYTKAFGPPVSLGISDGIKLNTFVDTNNNGTQDGGEQNVFAGTFEIELNDSGNTVSHYTTDGVALIYETNPTNSYDVVLSLDSYACHEQYALTTSSYSNMTVPAGSGITTYNFPVITAACSDLTVQLSTTGPRPGFLQEANIYYTNYGTQAVPLGTITFNPDNLTPTTSISQTGTVPNGDGFTFTFSNLQPNETRSIQVFLQVPTIPTVNIGDLVTHNVSITIPANDNFPENNVATSIRAVSNSFDPNDIVESHGERILHAGFTPNDYLTYTIRFENTGNANAINIRVNEVLDAKLDETSIRMVTASNDYVLERDGNVLNWKFNGIGLPPSLPNSNIGKGLLMFEIKPKPGYAIGDIIPSTANIYFDFSPAITTNTFITEFVATLQNPEFNDGDLVIHPNPASSLLHISLAHAAIDNVEIHDIYGKAILAHAPNSQTAAIDVSGLPTGIYFVKISSGDKQKTIKVIKE